MGIGDGMDEAMYVFQGIGSEWSPVATMSTPIGNIATDSGGCMKVIGRPTDIEAAGRAVPWRKIATSRWSSCEWRRCGA